jgi:hypothetical protein
LHLPPGLQPADQIIATNSIQVNNNRQGVFLIGSNDKYKKLIFIGFTNVQLPIVAPIFNHGARQ